MNNIGSKIQSLALIIGVGGTALAGFGFLISLLIAGTGDSWEEMTGIILALLFLIPGCIVSALLLYGFGELIEKVSIIADRSSEFSGTVSKASASYAATVNSDLPEL